MNFDHAVDEFRRYLRQNNYSKSTITAYCKTIRQTLRNKDLDTLSQRELDDINLELMERYEINGNRIRYAAINLFCRKILKRNDLYLKIPRSRIKNKDILTHEQVEKILKVAKTRSRTVYAVLQTIYDCALRKSEVCNLDLDDVNFETMELSLRNTKTGDAIVYMTTRVADAIRDYILYERKPARREEKALFVNKHGKRIGEHFVRNHLKECAARAGIKCSVYPHMLRATCITHLLNRGVNPLTVQHHARHRSSATTMIYNRPTQQQMKADIERVFVAKSDLTTEEKAKVVFDKYLRGELTLNELQDILQIIQPKSLKARTEFLGYV